MLDKSVAFECNTPEELLFIVKSAAFAYSVLRGWGYRMHYPVAAIIEDLEVSDEIAEKIGIFAKRVINVNLPPVEFREILKKFHDDVCVLVYVHGRYSSENMETILSLAAGGGDENLEMDMLLLVVFQKVIPEEYEEQFSLAIQIDIKNMERIKREKMEAYLAELKKYILTRTQVAEYEISMNREIFREDKDFRFWSAVINLMIPVCECEGEEAKERLRKRFYITLQKAYDLSEMYEFNRRIPALFRDALDKAIPSKCKLLPEEKASNYLESDLLDHMLYDSDFYYIPEELFKKICEPLNHVCTDNQIKAVLAKEGVLCTQGRGRIYRTLKKTVGGSSFRFVWLKKDALEGDTMEMSFVDIFQIRKAKLSGNSSKEGGKKKIGAVFKTGEVTNKPGGRGRQL